VVARNHFRCQDHPVGFGLFARDAARFGNGSIVE
jgi:hypothetical protein